MPTELALSEKANSANYWEHREGTEGMELLRSVGPRPRQAR